jgi:hypothetical protein
MPQSSLFQTSVFRDQESLSFFNLILVVLEKIARQILRSLK